MFSGKLGVMKQKWGHSSSLSSTASTTLTKSHMNTNTCIHRPSLRHHLAVDSMTSSAVAHPVFPLAVRLVCQAEVVLTWGMKDERERVKRRMRRAVGEDRRAHTQTCHHLTTPLFPTTWPLMISPFFPYNLPFILSSFLLCFEPYVDLLLWKLLYFFYFYSCCGLTETMGSHDLNCIWLAGGIAQAATLAFFHHSWQSWRLTRIIWSKWVAERTKRQLSMDINNRQLGSVAWFASRCWNGVHAHWLSRVLCFNDVCLLKGPHWATLQNNPASSPVAPVQPVLNEAHNSGATPSTFFQTLQWLILHVTPECSKNAQLVWTFYYPLLCQRDPITTYNFNELLVLWKVT